MRGTRLIGGSLSVLLFLPLSVAADVRVGLFQKELPDHFVVSSAGGLRVRDIQTGKMILTIQGNRSVSLQKVDSKVRLSTADAGAGDWFGARIEPLQPSDTLVLGTERVEKRPVRGALEIQAWRNELLAINIVSDSDYLNAVVATEMPVSWPMEALKAQAVVARTYIQKERSRHSRDGYDFCDLAHCQVYQGTARGNSRVREAVSRTDGEVLLYRGETIEAFFHSTCGGRTASNEDVWPGSARPYLRGRPDSAGTVDFCRRSPDYRWTTQMSKQDLGELLKSAVKEMEPGTLQSIEIKSLDSSGRVKELEIRFSRAAPVVIPAYTIYLLWGRSSRWHQLKSTWFEMSSWGNTVEFRGKGLGHGIGLCQWGAYGRAEQGYDYRGILQSYFPETQIGKSLR